MDLLKNLVVIAVLAVIAGGVYIVLTNNAPPKPPAEVENWAEQTQPPQIEVPSVPSSSASLPGVPSGMGPSGDAMGSSEAPPFRPAPPPAAIQSGSDAPPFSPPSGDYPNVAISHTEPLEPQPSKLPLRSDSMQFAPPPASQTAPPAEAAPRGIRSEFAALIDAAIEKLNAGGMVEAHESLSFFYANPRLTPEEDRQLTTLLDQVAGTVIYSREHYLEPPYVVQPGETLPQIGEKYQVPWQLLAKINGVRDPERLQPGRELKVVRGPFNAVIHLGRFELTLMLQGRYYAGRFPIGIGQDHPVLENTSYTVRDKIINPTYYGNGQVIDADDPNNPLGERLIGLGNRMSIHGTNDPQSLGHAGGPGMIRLSNRDIEDVYDILSIGSRVVINR